jgi:hypothetical protein
LNHRQVYPEGFRDNLCLSSETELGVSLLKYAGLQKNQQLLKRDHWTGQQVDKVIIRDISPCEQAFSKALKEILLIYLIYKREVNVTSRILSFTFGDSIDAFTTLELFTKKACSLKNNNY